MAETGSHNAICPPGPHRAVLTEEGPWGWLCPWGTKRQPGLESAPLQAAGWPWVIGWASLCPASPPTSPKEEHKEGLGPSPQRRQLPPYDQLSPPTPPRAPPGATPPRARFSGGTAGPGSDTRRRTWQGDLIPFGCHRGTEA